MIKDKNGTEIIAGMYISKGNGEPMCFVTKVVDDCLKVEMLLFKEEVEAEYEFVPAE